MKYRLNLTSSLANTKTLLQVGVFHDLTWEEICKNFETWHINNKNDIKDTYGFTLGEFKTYSYNEWRIKLYEYYLKAEDAMAKVTDGDTKRDKSIIYKYEQVKTEELRLNLLHSLFPSNTYNMGFHRVSRDLISKHAVILDIDNTLIDINEEAKNNHIIPSMIHPNELMYKLNQFNFIAYSSWSSTNNHPKFRIIIPTDEPYNISQAPLIREWFLNCLSVRSQNDYIFNLIDITALEPSRFFYVPMNKPNNSGWFKINNTDNFLSVKSMIKERSTKAYFKTLVPWSTIKKVRKEVSKNA